MKAVVGLRRDGPFMFPLCTLAQGTGSSVMYRWARFSGPRRRPAGRTTRLARRCRTWV